MMAALAGQTVLAAGLDRQANSTLTLPLEPYQYTAVEAFSGLLFDQPVAIVSPPGETNRLFIVERQGTIQVITNLVNPTKTVFLDIAGRVDPSGEGGLLGMAFHPSYLSNHYFYVYYTLATTTATGTGFHDRLARFEISPTNPNQALSDSELPLISQYDEANNHNGGDLHFGPDGYLYVSLGDEGGGSDNFGNSQRIDGDFFSAMLRIDVDQLPGSLAPNAHPAVHPSTYAIPADNPFVGATSFNGTAIISDQVRSEFWAVGLRNPWRFSFDPATGRIYCGEVGQGAWEEIDIIVRGGNYGWNYREGAHAFIGAPPSGVSLIEPIHEYSHSSGDLCVIGGLVYRGAKIPQLFGDYVFGDYETGNIWALHYDGSNATNFRKLTGISAICAFGQDPSNQDILMGRMHHAEPICRLVYREDVATPLPPTLTDTGAFQDVATLQPNAGIVPYDLNVPFWSDHARKSRWFSVPGTNQFVGFNSISNWTFPTGTVWIKHFELELTNGVAASARRLETRFIVRNANGVHGATYRWDSPTNATLVPEEGLNETFLVHDGGTVRTQVWHYPGRAECLACHTPAGGLALGFNTFQLNRDHDYDGTVTNQILALSQMGYFTAPVTNVAGTLAYDQPSNESATVEHRVRSYLGANCVQCHQPGATGRGYWDARLTTPLLEAGIVNGPLIDDNGDTNNRVIAPGSLERSMMFGRIAQLDARHMPPLATSELNQEAIALLARWITNDLASLAVTLPAGGLAYTENDGPVILDPGATVTAGSGVSLAGGTLTVEFTLNGAAEDRLAVHHVGNSNGEIGVLGGVVSYGGMAIGTLTGGTSGTDPFVVSFNSSATAAAAQALLRNVTYENVSPTPATLTRTVRATVADSGGSTSSQASMTISVQSVPAVPVVVWSRPADIVYGTPLTAAQLNPSANVPGAFVFDPPIGHFLDTGNDQALAATFTPQDTNNYVSVTASNLVTVTKASLVITADDKTKVYGAALPELTATYSGLVNGDNAAALDTPVSLSTPATGSSAAGIYSIVASGASDANYAISFADGTLTVTKAPLTITAEDKSRAFGLPNPTLTAVYAVFVNGDTASSLDTAVNLTTTATPGSPVASYPIVASGATDANYSITHVNGTLTVIAPNVPEVSLPADNLVYTEGAGSVLLDATATVVDLDSASFDGGGLTVSFATNGSTEDRLAIRNEGTGAGQIGVSGNEVSYGGVVIGTFTGGTDGSTPLAIGFNANATPESAQALLRNVTYENISETPSTLIRTVRVSVDDGDGGVSAPASMTVSVVTVPDDPVIIWVNPAPIVYGTALSSAQLNARANVPGTFIYDPPEGIVLAAGTGQTLKVTFTPTDSTNFNSGSANVAVDVSPKSLTITADSKSKTYGAARPALTASYVGFASGDGPASLDTPVDLSTAATAASGVGFYPIVASGAADANYAISFVDGILTVTKAPLTIKADDKSKVYGQANPPLTASYNGFVNGETTTDLDAPVALTTSAGVGSPSGSYPVVPSGAADPNYSIDFLDGTLTVTKAALVITAEDKRRRYGEPDPPLTARYSAFANGETAADLDAPVSLTTGATPNSPAGVYPIIAAGASDVNYQITFTDGVLTIEPKEQVNSITLESGEQVRIRFTGLSGRPYRVEASGDLSFWATVGMVQPDSNGEGEFVESAGSSGSTARFYRLVWP